MNKFFAVFAVARAGNGLAATTRAADRGSNGLPSWPDWCYLPRRFSAPADTA